MASAARLGRLFLGFGLLGFGVENVLYGHYVVARATPWPADPAAAFLFACVTGAMLVAAGLAVLTGRGPESSRSKPRCCCSAIHWRCTGRRRWPAAPSAATGPTH